MIIHNFSEQPEVEAAKNLFTHLRNNPAREARLPFEARVFKHEDNLFDVQQVKVKMFGLGIDVNVPYIDGEVTVAEFCPACDAEAHWKMVQVNVRGEVVNRLSSDLPMRLECTQCEQAVSGHNTGLWTNIYTVPQESSSLIAEAAAMLIPRLEANGVEPFEAIVLAQDIAEWLAKTAFMFSFYARVSK